MKDTFMFPTYLGGSGDIFLLFKDFPYLDFPSGYKYYFTGTMGFHLANCIHHLTTTEKSNDYFEMIVHHLVTLYLYGYSYMIHACGGGVIAVLHDIADIFISNARIWAETEY